MEEYQTILAEMATMKKRLDEYEKNYENNISQGSDTAPKACVAGSSKDTQRGELTSMQEGLKKIEEMVDLAMKRLSAVEKRVDDLEQYSRSNCLVIHGCENVPTNSKPGKYLEIENYVCKLLNEKLQLDSPLDTYELDIAHQLPSDKGTPIIVKFLRRTRRNEIYRKKRLLKGSSVIITESLTRRRLKLLEKVRAEFDQCPVWTLKGEVFVLFNNKKIRINDFSDIPKTKANRSFAQIVKG